MIKLIEYLVLIRGTTMQLQINGKVMNQFAIFLVCIIMLQFVADITGLTSNLDITYNLIHTAPLI